MKKDEVMINGTIMKQKTLLLVWSIFFTLLGWMSYALVTSKGQWFTILMGILAILFWLGFFGYDNFQKAKGKR